MRASGIMVQAALVLSILIAATSCGTFGGKSEGTATASAPSAPVSGDADREARLREAVESYVQSTGKASDDSSGKLEHKTPYYFKEYYLYPNGAAEANVDMQETESRTVPYRASVKVDKQRYATKLHRKREDAVGDSAYARDTGKETLTFEMRNGRWYRAGSMFVAEKTEEYVNGEWVPAKEEVERTVAAEEEQAGSWWARAWESVTGRSLHNDEPPPPVDKSKQKPKASGMQMGPSSGAKRHQQ